MDCHEGALRTITRLMNHLSEQLFAGPGLSE